MVVADVLESLEEASVPERREKAASYFPSRMGVLGVPVPAQRTVLRALARDLKAAPPSMVLGFARDLLATGVHEARQVAFELVAGRPDVMDVLAGPEIEALGRGSDNWASVDCYGVYLAGPAWRNGRISDDMVLGWTRSPDRWWRRTALVATVALNLRSRGGRGDPERTLAVCEALADDRDPMVMKALSWALRSLVGVAPDEVQAFLARHGDDLPALVRREVGNKLITGLKRGGSTA